MVLNRHAGLVEPGPRFEGVLHECDLDKGISMKKAVVFYLDKINPIVAAFIFLWCLWIFICPVVIEILHHTFKWNMVKALIDGREYYLQMFIVIKGLFCSIMLWIVGEYFKLYFLRQD